MGIAIITVHARLCFSLIFRTGNIYNTLRWILRVTNIFTTESLSDPRKITRRNEIARFGEAIRSSGDRRSVARFSRGTNRE